MTCLIEASNELKAYLIYANFVRNLLWLTIHSLIRFVFQYLIKFSPKTSLSSAYGFRVQPLVSDYDYDNASEDISRTRSVVRLQVPYTRNKHFE